MQKNIVLLHGWGATVEKLASLKKELERLHWRVFLAKLPGFDLVPPKGAWGLDEYSKFVLKDSEKFFKSSRFFLFGHSFGGGVAIKLALNNQSQIYGIILCETRGMSRSNIVKRYFFFFLSKAGKLLNIFPGLARFWKKLIYKLAREHDYEKAQGVMKEVFKKVVGEDLRPYVKLIKVPVLILWGKDDRMTPLKGAYFIEDVLPGSKLVTFDGIGHRLPYEKPVELAKEIDKWVKNLH